VRKKTRAKKTEKKHPEFPESQKAKTTVTTESSGYRHKSKQAD
jgi:hypothetical protein